MIKDIVIVGAGGFGREVKTLIDAVNSQSKTYNLLGFYDDALQKGTLVNQLPVLGKIADLNAVGGATAVALGIGNPLVKEKIVVALSNPHLSFPTLIDPHAVVSNDAVTLGEGTLICAGNILTCNIKIGRFVTLNLMCTVGHDTVIGDFASFMPAVNISGEVQIADCVYVGTGAKIINQLTIGKAAIIGAGAVVSKNIPEHCTAVGIPARPIKFHDHE